MAGQTGRKFIMLLTAGLLLALSPRMALAADGQALRRDGAFRLFRQEVESRILLAAQGVAANPTLTAGVEELDVGGVEAVLTAECGHAGLSVCALFDLDGDLMTTSVAAGVDKTATSLAGPTVDAAGQLMGTVWWETYQGRLLLSALTGIGAGEDRTGYLRVSAFIDSASLRELSEVIGADLAMICKGGRCYAGTFAEPLRQELLRLAAASPTATAIPGEGFSLTSVELKGLGHDVSVVWQAATLPADGRAAVGMPLTIAVVVALGLLMAVVIAGVWLLQTRRAQLRRYTAVLGDQHEAEVLADLMRIKVTGLLARHREALLVVLRRMIRDKSDAAAAMGAQQARLSRLADLLRISSAEFNMFCARVTVLEARCREAIAGLRMQGAEADRAIRPAIREILRTVHTIKSNARLLHLQKVHHAARDFEDFLVQCWQQGKMDLEGYGLLEENFQYIIHEVASYRELREQLLGPDQQEMMLGRERMRYQWMFSLTGRLFSAYHASAEGSARMNDIFWEYQDARESIGREDIRDYVVRYNRMAQDIAQATGKRIRPVRLSGAQRYFPASQMQELSDALLHCIRNAIDHGIEPPHQRTRVGKPPEGTIRVVSSSMSGLCVIRIEDDGKGVVPGQLRDAAVRLGLLTPPEAAALSDEQALDLVFADGISTAAHAGDLSGRGFGLDAVRGILQALGGDATFRSDPGAGSVVELRLPIGAGKFSSLLHLVNVSAMVRASLRESMRLASGQSPVLDIHPDIEARPLVACERRSASRLFSEIFTALMCNGVAPQDIRVALAHHHDDGLCSLDMMNLRITATAGGHPALLSAPVCGELENLALEAGLVLLMPEQGAFEVLIPSVAAKVPSDFVVKVWLVSDDPSQVEALLRSACDHFVPGLRYLLVEQPINEADGPDRDHLLVLVDCASAQLESVGWSGMPVRPGAFAVLYNARLDLPALPAVIGGLGDPVVTEHGLDEQLVRLGVESALSGVLQEMASPAPPDLSLSA